MLLLRKRTTNWDLRGQLLIRFDESEKDALEKFVGKQRSRWRQKRVEVNERKLTDADGKLFEREQKRQNWSRDWIIRCLTSCTKKCGQTSSANVEGDRQSQGTASCLGISRPRPDRSSMRQPNAFITSRSIDPAMCGVEQVDAGVRRCGQTTHPQRA